MKQPSLIQIFSVLLFLTGIVLRFWIHARKFNRRTITGLEGFSSYGRAVTITFIEKLGIVLSKIMILAAIILFLAAYSDHFSSHHIIHHKETLQKTLNL
jgi:prolipoprotein diacylglyceryltransferase